MPDLDHESLLCLLLYAKMTTILLLTAVNEYFLYSNLAYFNAALQGLLYAYIGLNVVRAGTLWGEKEGGPDRTITSGKSFVLHHVSTSSALLAE